MTGGTVLWIGHELYLVPRRAKVIHPEGETFAVGLFEGALYLLTATGQIPVPDRVYAELLRRYFPRDAEKLLR